MLRLVASLLVVLVCAKPAVASDQPPTTAGFAAVDVAPTKTSIYVGVVSMTMSRFARSAETYTADYAAKVIPYFFYNEKGRLTVDMSDEKLAQLSRGETIEFTGQAVREDGEVRRVEGKATPVDATNGTLKVRVFVSKRIQLIFNTTYRFAGDGGKTE